MSPVRKCDPGCGCGKHNPGGEVGYSHRHKLVYRTRGKASDYQCVTCCQQAKQWAQAHGTDGTDVLRHYMPMCVFCHHHYDGILDAVSKAKRGSTWTTEQRAKLSRTSIKRNAEMTPEQRSAIVKKAWETRWKNGNR